MIELEKGIVDIFRLYTVSGVIDLAEYCVKNRAPEMLSYKFSGLLPLQDRQAQRDSTKDEIWPQSSIRHLIEQVGENNLSDYITTISPLAKKQLPKQVFILLTTSFDDFLERKGYSDTLGKKYNDIKNKMSTKIPAQLYDDFYEVIQRRNDVIHGGGKVRAKYINAAIQNSTWIKKYSVPATSGIEHEFPKEYLYLVTSVIYDIAKFIP